MTEEEIQPFTRTEAQRILAATAGRRNGVRFALALALGLRQGEALGLQWRDVDLEHGTLTNRRAIQRLVWQHGCSGTCGRKRGADCPTRHGGGLVVAETKSPFRTPGHWHAGRSGRGPAGASGSAGRRTRAGADLWHDGGWLFAQPTGKPVDPRADYAEWQALLKAAGVRPARLHDARHTAATMLIVASSHEGQ